MKWAEWTELIPDPERASEHGGVVRARVLLSGPGRAASPAIQRRLRTFGRREVPVGRNDSPLRLRSGRMPLRQRLRLALGLVLLAVVVLVGRRG